jgi:phosphoglycerol transferase MdoB-like AlkP superfamily enzyme
MKNDDATTERFNRFLIQFRKDAKQWVFFMLMLTFFRIVFLFLFRARLAPGTPGRDIVLTALNGLRYDSMVSTYWVLIPVLAAVLSAFLGSDRLANAVRRGFGAAFVAATSVAWIFTYVFFREYNEQFNQLVFNLYYDDAKAILLTIWADYHPIPVFIAVSLVVTAGLALRKRFVRDDAPPSYFLRARRFSLPSKTLTALLILALLVVASRGSVGRRPAQRKDAAISRDEFLNKADINPYFALLFAVQDHELAIGLAGLGSYLPDQNVRKAAQVYFNDPRSFDDLDSYLLKRAKGPKTVPPRHIFLVVMESYDAWPFLPKYSSLGLTHSLSELGRKGLFFHDFLPASDGTMQSLSSIMTGLPYTHVEINYQLTSRTPYPSSLAMTFRRLGYRTRLFYGGYLSWQRFGAFAKDQGFEEIYGAPHMERPGVETHEWGVDDEYLLDFIVQTVDDDKPSFNLIMTTSYHPPYNVDVRAKGFPLTKVPDEVKPMFDGSTSLRILGHLWYADKCLGDFVKKAGAKLSRPLFVFTGDHFGRKFINARPDYYEHAAVPLILYGKEVLRGLRIPRGAAGSHMDIGPTLIELAAPKGFEYYSVGRDLLAPRSRFIGIGWERMVGKDFLFDVAERRFYPLPGKTLPNVLPSREELLSLFDDAYGIGWWRVRRGNKLPK